MKKIFLLMGVFSIILIVSSCGQDEQEKPKEEIKQQDKIKEEEQQSSANVMEKHGFFEPFNGKIDHVHGMGYVGNQNALFFAAHDGIKVYENNRWYKTKKQNHDYMGFNATKNGFYTSGHPEPDSNLLDPFGIKRSTDNGETLVNVALNGEVDFHSMGVGYENNVIYVISPHENSLMESNKLYVSEDEGKTYNEISAKGFSGEIITIAVHPNNANIVAIAGGNGVFLSEDKGENFGIISKEGQGTSVFFTDDNLWYGTYKDAPTLTKYSLENNSIENILLPKMDQDAVLYFAQNPQNEKEMTFVTFRGSIYQTKDNASNWNLLVKEGMLKDED